MVMLTGTLWTVEAHADGWRRHLVLILDDT